MSVLQNIYLVYFYINSYYFLIPSKIQEETNTNNKQV